MQPLSRDMQALLEKKNMSVESPILVRIFKEESELEVWKKDAYGQLALLKTYPICRWSGDLGPKVKQGDRQAPEGFYTITPGQMNPNSQYYLAFNLGFPNAFDRAYDRSGAFLMVHGDCSSAGCYSMSDEQMAEIYALGREAFLGGQKSFQVQAFPFRMTAVNLAKHRTNPHLAFWRMIKEGNDHFEVTRQEPRVDVCDKRYVFNAIRAPNAKSDPVFNASAKCPAYAIPDEIADLVRDKQQQDDAEYASLVAKGTPVAKLNTGIDGGMHPVFASHVPGGSTGLSEGGEGQGLSLAAFSRAPGTIPGTVNPPRATWQVQQDQPAVAVATPSQAQAGTKVASAAPSQPPAQELEGFFASLGRKMGITGASADTTATATAQPTRTKAADAKPLPKAFKPVETNRRPRPGRSRQAGRRSSPRSPTRPLPPQRTTAARARQGRDRRRSTADRADQLVRQSLFGREVRPASQAQFLVPIPSSQSFQNSPS